MNRSITLSARGALVAVVAVLALLVAYLLGSGGSSAQAAPSSADTGQARTLVMTGTGRTVGVPDELSFSLSVGLVRPDLQTALADANATMGSVLAALDRLGVRRSDVQTTGLSMNAVYDYHSYGPPTLRGYHVGQRATGARARPDARADRRSRRRSRPVATTSVSASSVCGSPTPTPCSRSRARPRSSRRPPRPRSTPTRPARRSAPVLSLREVHVTPVVSAATGLRAGGPGALAELLCRSEPARTSWR